MKIADRRWPLVAAPVFYVLVLCVPSLLSGEGLVLGARSGDLFLQFVQQREFGFGEVGRGHLPLWNPHIFSGMPALGNVQFALCYPLNLLFVLLPLQWAFNVSIMAHLALAGIFMGIWARSRGTALLPAVAAGILYLGCGAHFSHVLAGHQTMICLLPWAPLLFWSVDAVADRGHPGPALIGAAALGLMVLAGYPQFVFHIGVAAALYAAVRLAGADGRLRKILLLGAIPFLAAGIAALQLAATVQASAGSLRGGKVAYDYAAMFSLPLENLLTLLSPFPWGGVRDEGYWGRWYLWETQLFFGLTGLLGALLALGRKEDRDRWFLLGLAGLMLLLALGDATPLFRALYELVPVFGHFRGHSKWILPASLFLILLAARGFESFLADPGKPRALPWLLATAAGGAGAIAAALFAGGAQRAAPAWWRSLPQAISRTGESYRLVPGGPLGEEFLHSSLRGAALACGIAAATLAVLVFLVLAARRRPKLAIALVGLASLEVYAFDLAYLPTFPIEQARRSDVSAALKHDPGDYRIHVVDHANSAMSTGALDVWGYDPFVPLRYAEFMAFSQGVPLDTPAVDIPMRRWDPLLGLVRLRYVFSSAADGSLETGGPFPHLPRALLVPAYAVMEGRREEILAAMRRADFDPSRIAILEATPLLPSGKPLPPALGSGTVRVVSRTTDEILVEAEADGAALLLLSDPYFHGWRARPLPGTAQGAYQIIRADYVLQAIPLAGGTHRIRLVYDPPLLAISGAISALTMVGMLCAGMMLRRRGRRPPGEEAG